MKLLSVKFVFKKRETDREGREREKMRPADVYFFPALCCLSLTRLDSCFRMLGETELLLQILFCRCDPTRPRVT